MKHSKRDQEKIRMSRKIVESLRKGESLTAIAKATHKGKGFVIKIRDLAITHGYLVIDADDSKLFTATARALPSYPELLFSIPDGRSEKVPASEEILKPKMEWIKERLGLGWSPQTIFEEINLPIARATLYRALERKNLFVDPRVKNQMELIHGPGECLQVDWGKLFDVVGPSGKKKTIWIFIGVLGHSRFEMARVVERLDFKTTIEVLMSMLEEMGGSPKRVTCDNPKVFTIKASRYEPELNQGFERFASHYGFTIEALPPAAPEKKGKVERMVPVKRRLFESYDIKNYSLESAQAHITKKIAITNERRHGSHLQRPIDVFLNDEAAKLKALPPLPYEIETIVSATVRADGYVRFDNKYYRIDQSLKKELALVIGNSQQVSIYCRGRLLEVYDRITDNFTTKACKDHYREPWEKTLSDHGHYLTRARSIGPNVERFIEIVLARGEGFVDTRVVWGLMTLNKNYENIDVDKACAATLELSEVKLTTVRKLLLLMATPKPKRNKFNNETIMQDPAHIAMGGKFARPISEYQDYLRLVHSSVEVENES